MGRKSTPPKQEPILISVQEMASMLSISRNQAYTLLDQGVIECRYIGRRRLVLLKSLRTFVDRLPDTRC
jgi:excisionase family DNA binding protein